MPPRFAVRPTRPYAHRNSAQYSPGGGQGSRGHDKGWADQAGQEESSYGRAPRSEEEEGWRLQQNPMKRPQDNRGHRQEGFADVGNTGYYGHRMDDDNDDEMLEDETSFGHETPGHRLIGNRGDEEMFLGSQGAEAQRRGYYGAQTFRNDHGKDYYVGGGPRLRSVLDFPAPLPSLFSKVFSFDVFNSVQTAVCEKALSDNSLVVVSPTGSGKTVIFELAICSLFQDQWGQKRGNGERKAIFLAPAKFLVGQKMKDWTAKFNKSTLGLTLAELTGDTQTSLSECLSADIILATPEKWDSTTRRWRDSALLISKIKLFMVDEIHTVGDETRGACLEACMCRMKTIRNWQVNAGTPPLRIVTVSATVPNPEDLGEWLGCDSDHTCVFGEEHRPVPLSYTVIGSSRGTRNEFVFDKSLNWKVPDIVRQHSDGRPVLVFCSTRKSAEQAAQHFATEAETFLTREHKQILWEASSKINKVKDGSLRDLLHAGVGFHNGSLEGEDRKVCEDLFIQRSLICLFTTSTLAVGANLPAYLVVIKGTSQYQSRPSASNKGWGEYDSASIQQMAGRAGRKGFDTEGKVIVITEDTNVDMYRKIMSCQKMIESHLHTHLIEHLNSEIVLETITDIPSVLDWASSTLLWVRAKKNPSQYFPKAFTAKDDSTAESGKIQGFIRKLMLDSLNKLMSTDIPIVKSMGEDSLTFKATELGITMAKFYVAFSSMERMIKLNKTTGMGEMITLISEMEEFESFHCRVEHKKMLEVFNKHDGVRYKVVRPSGTGGWTTARKVECLMQAAIGGVPIDKFNLKVESTSICDAGSRVTYAMVEYCISQKFFSTAVKAVKLHQAVTKKTWEDDTNGRLMMQMKGIGETMTKKLCSAGITNLRQMDRASAAQLDSILGRSGMGSDVLEELRKVPCYAVQMNVVENDHAKSFIKVEVVVMAQHWNGGGNGKSWNLRGHLIVGFKDGNMLLSRKFKASVNNFSVHLEVDRNTEGQTELMAHALHEAFVGRDAVTMLTLTGVRGTLKRPLNDDKTASGKGDNAKDGSTTVKKPKTKSAKQPHTPALQQPSWDVRVGSETPRTPAQQQQQQQVGQQKCVTSSNSQQQQQPDGSLQGYLKSVQQQHARSATIGTPVPGKSGYTCVQSETPGASYTPARHLAPAISGQAPSNHYNTNMQRVGGSVASSGGCATLTRGAGTNITNLHANIEELDRYKMLAPPGARPRGGGRGGGYSPAPGRYAQPATFASSAEQQKKQQQQQQQQQQKLAMQPFGTRGGSVQGPSCPVNFDFLSDDSLMMGAAQPSWAQPPTTGGGGQGGGAHGSLTHRKEASIGHAPAQSIAALDDRPWQSSKAAATAISQAQATATATAAPKNAYDAFFDF